jgi:hypothetical protein
MLMVHISTALAYLPIVTMARESARSDFRDKAHYWLCVRSVTVTPSGTLVQGVARG